MKSPPQKRRKRPPVARNWFITIQGEKFDWPDNDRIRYAVYAPDSAPTTGQPHWHVYAQFYKQVRFTTIEDIFGTCDHRICHDKDAVIQYIKDKGNYKEIGDYVRTRQRSDLLACKQIIDEGGDWYTVCQSYFSDAMRYRRSLQEYRTEVIKKKLPKWKKITVTVLWGKTDVGKTKYVVEKEDDLYIVALGDQQQTWFDGYMGEKAVLFDDFYGQIKISWMLRLLDGYKNRLPIKGGHVYAEWDRVYITSNTHPSSWYKHVPKDVYDALLRRIDNCEQLLRDVNSALVNPTFSNCK